MKVEKDIKQERGLYYARLFPSDIAFRAEYFSCEKKPSAVMIYHTYLVKIPHTNPANTDESIGSMQVTRAAGVISNKNLGKLEEIFNGLVDKREQVLNQAAT